MSTSVVDTSVVIRAYNEEKHLGALLKLVMEQEHPGFEVIVVDSGSYDRTPVIARNAGARLIEIHSRDFTFGYSLNVGVREARGRHIAIVSAHTRPIGTHWLSALIAPLRDDGVAMVFGKQLGTGESKFAERMDFERNFDDRPRDLHPGDMHVNNANSAIRRDLWEEHEFDEFIPGLEDLEWAHHWIAQGRRVVYEPRAAIYHIHEESWAQVRRRYYREAEAARRMGLVKPRAALLHMAREAWRFLDDVRCGLGQGARLGEIARFRWSKAMGTASGLWNGKEDPGGEKREKLYFNRSYPAVSIKGPGRAALVQQEIPKLKPGDVLVEVAWEGVCGTDLEILRGELGYFQNGLAQYPIVPGHEFSGWVSRVGANAGRIREGDRVVVECIQSCGACAACRAGNTIGCPDRREVGVMRQDGGYAQYVLTPSRFVHAVPTDVDLRRAALTEPLAVVLKGMRRLAALAASSEVPAGVVGAGPIGHLAALLLAREGREVLVYDRSAERLAAFDGSRIRTTQSMEGIRELRVVVEATGDPGALEDLLERSPAGSCLLLLGLPYARRPFTFEHVVAYDRAVIGSVGSTAADFDEALRLLRELRLDPFLQLDFPLQAFQRAWEAAQNREALKVMLRVAGE